MPGAQHYTHLGDRGQGSSRCDTALALVIERRAPLSDWRETALAEGQRPAVRHTQRLARR
jgi:hypothetical protein